MLPLVHADIVAAIAVVVIVASASVPLVRVRPSASHATVFMTVSCFTVNRPTAHLGSEALSNLFAAPARHPYYVPRRAHGCP